MLESSAHWVQSIRNRPEINQRVSKAAHIKELSTEIERLKADLFATREKNGIYMNPDECVRRLLLPGVDVLARLKLCAMYTARLQDQMRRLAVSCQACVGQMAHTLLPRSRMP